MNAGDWKRWYADERRSLGEARVSALLDRAPVIPLPPGGALVFPHAKLAVCGSQVAAVAKALIEARVEEVVALGVLHGGRASDAELVRAAKAGDPAARARMRRLHGPGADGDEGYWAEEFSLDNFKALLEIAAKRSGRRAPRVVERYPLLSGSGPGSLHGLDDLRPLLARGAALVATTDPVHHGHGYRTPAVRILDDKAPSTPRLVLEGVSRAFESLARREYHDFLRECDEQQSDFRDTGPAMASLLEGAILSRIAELCLVDYSDVLAAPRPTWVAAALATFERDR
ncbi:MAG: hypothetical protein FD180_1119 [Planctomycetota bacterium]|nr:MAG: hypothetical protein FD180_1119 [Planctomycetota bacterium]